MGFINTQSTIIRKSSKNIFNIYNDRCLKFDLFDGKNNFISSISLDKYKNIDFTNSYFSLDKDDSIYGIYKDNALKILELDSNNEIYTNDVLLYDANKFDIMYPYIKMINGSIHILYYVFNKNNSNTCALVHHFYRDGVWKENKIDFIQHNILDKFTVAFKNNSLVVFYLNLVNGFEEVFFSKFDMDKLKWSTPNQITNSNKSKIYLSVLEDDTNFYHIAFCENLNNGLRVKYINGHLDRNTFNINTSNYITGPSVCMYPNILRHDNSIYIMWVNFNKLYTSVSTDLGKTWSDHSIDEYSMEEGFCISNFISNYLGDKSYNSTAVFSIYKNIDILGF